MDGFLNSNRDILKRRRGCLFLDIRLLAETKFLDDCTIALDVLSLEVGEETTTLTYELNQGTIGNVILVVCLHVLSEVLNTVGEECNLALARTSVSGRCAILGKNLCLLC